jgi:hypothetical protein
MGDRVSISFSNQYGEDESVALFNHWGGEDFVDVVKGFLAELATHLKKDGKFTDYTPLDRLEPQTIMLNFVLFLGRISVANYLTHSFYLGKDRNDGDNSDNGHYLFKLHKSDNELFYTIIRSRDDYLCFDEKAGV